MFNRELFQKAFADYKANFNSDWWKFESYKWEAIKTFQDNFNLETPNNDFSEMLKRSLAKTGNLLNNKGNFALGMICEFAEKAPASVREMFRNLFNEDVDLFERYDSFVKRSDELLKIYCDPGKRHFQGLHDITVYLWLKFPSKHYIYKFGLADNMSKSFKSDYNFKKGAYELNTRNFLKFYEEVNSEIQKDKEIKKILSSFITENCYPDEYLHTLTVDFGFYLNKVKLNSMPHYNYWKISHGTDDTGIKSDLRDVFAERKVAVVHGMTNPLAKNSVSQGEWFSDYINEGDYFYLCYGNSIQLFGQFTSDEATENAEIGNNWLERPYEVIAFSKDKSKYIGESKWWTPDFNSTCVPIKIEEEKEFEERILKPYFDLDMKKLEDWSQTPYNDKYTKEDFLSEVYISANQYDTLVGLLENKKNLILQGAPGVGKTYAAKRLAYSIIGEQDDSCIEFVQFHQNYSYEDFILGYKPNGNGGFDLKEGTFYRFCQKAQEDRDKKYFFIIDEINRGNLSKIFGELMMLLEKDYRDQELTLAYGEKRFSIPQNVYILGMMNTADRSLAMIDYALRRRFAFFKMTPAFDNKNFADYVAKFNSAKFDDLIKKIKELNIDITQDSSLGEGFCIGHSYFSNFKEEDFSEKKLKLVVNYDIIPMLEEYWFDEKGNVNGWKKTFDEILR